MSAHHHHHHTQLPRAALRGACALVVFTILAAGVGRITGMGVTELPPGVAVQERQLRFEDQSDGGVAVYEEGVSAAVHRIDPGHQGFVRGVLRGFARARRLHGLDDTAPFVLTRWADGRLSLHDPQTGHVVALEAFGPDNAAAFVELMPALGAPVQSGNALTGQESASRRGGDNAQHNG